MSKKLFLSFLGLLLIASMVLSACQTATEVPTSEPTQEPLPSEEPTAEPTEEVPAAPTTTRHGGWLDTVVVVKNHQTMPPLLVWKRGILIFMPMASQMATSSRPCRACPSWAMFATTA